MAKHSLTVLAGVLSVVPLLAALTMPGGMVFVLIAPLPLFLAGLGQGINACWIAGLVAVVLWALIGGPAVAIGALISVVAPVCVLVRQALRARTTKEGTVEWYPSGLLIGWLTGLGIIWLMAGVLMLASTHGVSGIEAALARELEPVLAQTLPTMDPDQFAEFASIAAAWGLGISAATWMVLLLALNGVLAQGMLTRFGRAMRPAPALSEMDLPKWPVWLLVVCLVIAIAASGWPAFIARNATLVMLVPFFFGGLAVVHSLCRRFKAGALLLAVFYAALLLWALVLPPALAVLGLMDQWAGFRRRFLAHRPGQEEE